MVTDRSSTAALLAVLAYFYPNMILLFAGLIALDITSHYAHLYRYAYHYDIKILLSELDSRWINSC